MDPELIDDAIDEDEGEQAECPACGGMGEAMGILGNLTHYRCRSCGMIYCEKTK